MNTIFRIAITFVIMQMLVDYAFYGRHPNYLAGAAGFSLLLIDSFRSVGEVDADGHRIRNGVAAHVIVAACALLILAHFLIKWMDMGT